MRQAQSLRGTWSRVGGVQEGFLASRDSLHHRPWHEGPFLKGTTCKPDHCVLLEAGEREVVTESWKPGPWYIADQMRPYSLPAPSQTIPLDTECEPGRLRKSHSH